MGCRTYSENLTAQIDGELSPAEEQELFTHLEECKACRSEHSSLLYATRVLERSLQEDLLESAPSWERIRSEIATPRPSWGNFRWLFQPRWAGAVAAVALLLFSVPFYWSATQPEAVLAQQLAAYVTERDQAEQIHQGIIQIEPVGWVTHNPFRVSRGASENPFSLE